MSLRQLRKLNLNGSVAEPNTEEVNSNSDVISDSNGIVPVNNASHSNTRNSVFLQAMGSDFQVSEADSASDLEENTSNHSPSPTASSSAHIANSECKKRKTNARRRRRAKPSLSVASSDESEEKEKEKENKEQNEENDIITSHPVEPAVSSCLEMERSAFDPEVDLRRSFGREALRASRTAVRGAAGSVRSRRQWLISPGGQNLPLVNPWMKMIISEDLENRNLEFSLQYTEEYARMQPVFHAAVQSHDPHVLREFCRANPFHPDGLLALSQSLAVAEMHELSFEALTQAVLSLQCAFHYAFNPFAKNADNTPQVAVDSGNPVNRQLFEGLVLYMFGLAEQGCHRCALEVSKLLLAMDLSNDISHALLHLDYFALRSRKHDFVHFFAENFVNQHLSYVVPLEENTYSSEEKEKNENLETFALNDLRLILPNFAFSAALASFMQTSDPKISSVKEVRARDICGLFDGKGEINEKEKMNYHHCLLMHAIILFPSFIRTLLQKLEIKGEQKVSDSIYPEIAWDTLLFALPLWRQGFPSHRRADKIHEHLVKCYVEKTHELWRSTLIIRWLHSSASHLFHLCQQSTEREMLLHYKTVWSLSRFLLDINRYSDVRISEFIRRPTLPSSLMENEERQMRQERQRGLRQSVSLRSSPFVLFFQTLLPWNELDLTGLKAEPVYMGHLFSAVKNFCVFSLNSFFRAVFSIAVDTLQRARRRYFCLSNANERQKSDPQSTPPSAQVVC